MTKILFLPSDHGGGMGHVSRCIFLAKRFNNLGHESAIVLEKKHYTAGVKEGIKSFLLDTKLERLQKYQFKRPFKPQVSLKTRIWKAPIFLEFNSLAYQVPRDGYVSEKIVDLRINKLDRIIYHFKPDVLIGDTHFLTYIIGKKNDIPVVQITRFAGYPPDPNFMWWKNEPVYLRPPQAVKPFHRVIDRYLDREITIAEDLLRGDHYIIPSCPEVEPISVNNMETQFVGPLAPVENNYADNPFIDFNNKLKRIYISIGGGASRSHEDKLFKKLIEIFNDSEYNVLISTGRRIAAKNYNHSSKNIIFVDWVHGLSAIHYADLIIFHGGYGTMTETLIQSKPSIVFPSHSEQEGNGQRLKNLGVGAVLPIHEEKLSPLEFTWPYGRYTILGGYELRLERKKVLERVTEVIEKKSDIKEISNNLKELASATDYESILNI